MKKVILIREILLYYPQKQEKGVIIAYAQMEKTS